MATQSLEVAHDPPVNLVVVLSLSIGDRYVLEVVPGGAALSMFEGGSSPPAAGDRNFRHTVMAGGLIGIEPARNEPIWVWSLSPRRPSQIVVSAST